MLKKLKTFLTSSLAVIMTINVARSSELKKESYDGFSNLAQNIDNPESEIVQTSKKVNSSLSKIFKKVLGAILVGYGLFNCIPMLTRIFTGKAEFDDIPIRFRGSKEYNNLNYVLDAAQVVIPISIGACILTPEKKEFKRNFYQKSILNAILNLGDENRNAKHDSLKQIVNINVNNYYKNLN